MISKESIQKINEEARVEEVVGEFVTLKKRGSNLLGLCPFHNEKTPSFNVNPARNIYKCFGCGKAGGPIQFLMEYQQMTYPDALRYLAKKYNIELDETFDEGEQREQQEKQNLTESIFISNAFAQKFFIDYMNNTESGKIGLAYFKERGFLNNTIEKFQLGFSPDASDSLTKNALKEGFQLDILKKAGLTSPKENSTYDFFRNRVMFPIHNMTGKVVGFGGRIMIKDEKAPKYVNTPESEVYQKSKILYGAYFAKNEIRKKDECLMVEGYTDVIQLHQSGIENAVASSGTSLTIEQIRLIKRITPNITMLYDGDKAGVKAALRGTDLILEEGMNVRVVILPETEDPDSYVRKVGADAFQQFIQQNKKDLILFKTSLFANEAKEDPIRKAELIRDIIESIGKIPDTIQRSVYVKECSQLFAMSEQILITEVNKIRRKKASEHDKEAQRSEEIKVKSDRVPDPLNHEQFNETGSHLPVLEREIIRILIEFGSWTTYDEETEIPVIQYVLDELEGLDLETPQYKVVYDLIKRQFADGKILDDKFFIANDDPQISSTAIDILAKPYSLSENWWTKYKVIVPDKKSMFAKDIHSAVIRFKQFKNISELKKIESRIKDAKDDSELLRLMKLHKLLMEQKKEFARTVGNVIYRPTT
ncbi:MAG: primase, catalytic core [Bacteroidota bacterium]|nr:primase, catalytic core [Bacteroidota bacterium]